MVDKGSGGTSGTPRRAATTPRRTPRNRPAAAGRPANRRSGDASAEAGAGTKRAAEKSASTGTAAKKSTTGKAAARTAAKGTPAKSTATERGPAAKPAKKAAGGTAASRTAPKKAAPKKAAPKKAAVKKAVPKRAAPTKTAVKKTAGKKTAGKKAAVKKKAAVRGTARTTGEDAGKAAGVSREETAGKAERGASGRTARKTARTDTDHQRKTGARPVVAKKRATAVHTPVSAAGGVPKARPAGVEPGVLPVRSGEDPWSEEEVAELRAGLLEDVQRLRSEILAAEEAISGLLRDSGGGAGDDEADTGTKNISREHEMALANNAREMLRQTEHALERVDSGTYGYCESCGNPIGKARLQAFPRATLCVECKQRQERR
jgi:RNA polymerase-binding protein DksA